MKLITWNINGIRARWARLGALLEKHNPDVVCLQETKIPDEKFPHELLAEWGYRAAIHGQKAYNGVAILTRSDPHGVHVGFEDDPVAQQARVISLDLEGVRVVCAYVVNGKSVEHEAYGVKLAWLDALTAWITRSFDPSTELILTGDFNVTPTDADVHDPERWPGRILCSEPERRRIEALKEWGLVDLHRAVNGDEPGFTWWDYRQGAFGRGWGLRIDLVLASAPLAARCHALEVDRDLRKKHEEWGNPSDHAPVVATFKDPV